MNEEGWANALEAAIGGGSVQEYRNRMKPFVEEVARRQAEFASAWEQVIRMNDGAIREPGVDAAMQIIWGHPEPCVNLLTTPQQIRYNEESTDDETGEEPHA